MDNVTHSLAGVALAELALPRAAPPRMRRVFMAAAIVAANLPDLDLVYTAITPAPLGYLLHHRGHTHTIAGLAGLALLLGVTLQLWPAARALAPPARARLWGLIVLNLFAHVSLDAFNSYGVHPFYPFDRRWYYGDAVFIFEPWIWLLLGAAAAANAQSRPVRAGIAALIGVLIAALGAVGLVPLVVVGAMFVVGGVAVRFARSASSHRRSAWAFGSMVAAMIALTGLSGIARARTIAATAAERRGDVIDVVLNPNPGMPLCWQAIAIEVDEAGGTYLLRRGTLSLAPRIQPPDACASHRFASGPDAQAGAAWAPLDETRGSLPLLRSLDEENCWVSAWLQFGRAPVVRGDQLLDLRFDNGRAGNFTTMPLSLGQGSGCPPYRTNWVPPRSDLLQPRSR